MKILIVTRLSHTRMDGFRYGRAFESLGHEVDYQYIDTEFVDKGYDFVYFMDNAEWHIYPKIFDIPCYYYAGDVGMDLGRRCVTQSANMDYVFCAQKWSVDLFNNSEWLPSAHDSCLHEKFTFNKESDRLMLASSVGDYRGPGRSDRHNIVKLIDEEFLRNEVYLSNSTQYKWLNNIYCNSCCVLNYNSFRPSLKYKDINLRIWEASGYGTVVITYDNINNGLNELGFFDKINCLTYTSDEEAIDLIRWVENNKEEALEMSKNAFDLVNEKHTYINRAKVILDYYIKNKDN